MTTGMKAGCSVHKPKQIYSTDMSNHKINIIFYQSKLYLHIYYKIIIKYFINFAL